MTTIQSRTLGTTSVAASLPAGADPPPLGSVDLMPPAGDPTSGDVDDTMSAMYAMLLADQSSDEGMGVSRAQSDETQRQEALRQQQQAIQRQARDSGGRGFFSCIGKLLSDAVGDVTHLRFDKLVSDVRSDVAACDNPQFWSDLEVGAKIVGAIAAAAATVCTAGAAGPVVVGVALALSAAGFAVQQTHCLGAASGWVGAGLELGGAIVSCGGTLAASGTAAASSLAQTAGSVANATSAGATVVSGAAHVGVSEYQADVADDQADAAKAAQTASFFAQMQQWAVDTLQSQMQAHRDAMNAVSDAMQTSQHASLLAAAPLSRG